MCRLGVFLLSAFAVVASPRLASHHDSSLKHSRLVICPPIKDKWVVLRIHHAETTAYPGMPTLQTSEDSV
jgi:hypothetical protein